MIVCCFNLPDVGKLTNIQLLCRLFIPDSAVPMAHHGPSWPHIGGRYQGEAGAVPILMDPAFRNLVLAQTQEAISWANRRVFGSSDQPQK
jgi:hypothetical protein